MGQSKGSGCQVNINWLIVRAGGLQLEYKLQWISEMRNEKGKS